MALFHFIPSTPNPLRWSKDFRYIYIGINPTSCLNILYPPFMPCNKIVLRNTLVRIDRQAIPATQREDGVRENQGIVSHILACSHGLNNYKDIKP